MNGRHVFVGQRLRDHDSVSVLEERTSGRTETSDVLLAGAGETLLENGVEYWLSCSEVSWDRVQTYIEEESACCPSLAFEALLESGGIRLIVFQPYAGGGAGEAGEVEGPESKQSTIKCDAR